MKIFTKQVLEKAIDYFFKIACLYIFIVHIDLLKMYHTPWRIDIKYKKNFCFCFCHHHKDKLIPHL